MTKAPVTKRPAGKLVKRTAVKYRRGHGVAHSAVRIKFGKEHEAVAAVAAPAKRRAAAVPPKAVPAGTVAAAPMPHLQIASGLPSPGGVATPSGFGLVPALFAGLVGGVAIGEIFKPNGPEVPAVPTIPELPVTPETPPAPPVIPTPPDVPTPPVGPRTHTVKRCHSERSEEAAVAVDRGKQILQSLRFAPSG